MVGVVDSEGGYKSISGFGKQKWLAYSRLVDEKTMRLGFELHTWHHHCYLRDAMI